MLKLQCTCLCFGLGYNLFVAINCTCIHLIMICYGITYLTEICSHFTTRPSTQGSNPPHLLKMKVGPKDSEGPLGVHVN